MPTPAGHSLAGLAVHLASRGRSGRPGWLAAAALIALANLPDVDFLPGYLIGHPRAFHWGATHSIAAALLAGTLAGWIARAYTGRFRPFFILGTVAYGSHILMDLLLGPGAPSLGLALLWPVSDHRFMAPWAVFEMFPAARPGTGPVGMLFSTAVLPLVIRELIIMVPVCIAAWYVGRGAQERKPQKHAEPIATQ